MITMRRLLIFLLLLFFAGNIASAQSDLASTAKLFEDAAVAREEAAKIWEGMNERVKATEAWNEAAASWEKAARAWNAAQNKERTDEAWRRFKQALQRRDAFEILLEVVSGNQQTVRVGRLSEPLTVRATDRDSKPIANVKVLFEISSKPGSGEGMSIEPITPVTDSNGIISARMKLGTTAGNYTISASVTDLSRQPVFFDLIATAGNAARLEIFSGNNQVMRVNQMAMAPLVARVTDIYGNPVQGISVQYRIVSEPDGAIGHSLSSEDAVTDASGLCGVRFQSGNLGGSYIVLVESENLDGSPSKYELMARQTIPTFRIIGTRFEGSTDTISLEYGSKIKSGETYLLPDLGRLFRDELKRIYATGRFDDVYASIEEGDIQGEGKAVFRMKERPKVSSIKIVGLKKVKENDIRGVMGLSEGAPFSVPALERTRGAMLRYLENEGYLNATVSAETTVVTAPPKEGEPAPALPPVAITYKVVEKDKVKVARMNLIGNKFFSDWSLNWHMKTGSGRVYKESEFEEDRRKVIGRYVERGYLSAVMDDPIITKDNRGRLILDIVIKEGPQYKIGDITFVGNTAVSSDELMSMLKPKKGATFRARKFFESLEDMRVATARHGYAECRVVPQERLDQEKGIVDFVIRVEEGHILYLEKIVVEGNTKTREKIITREIRLRQGEVLNGEEIERARKRLEALQFFEQGSVQMSLREGSKPDQRVLAVKVAEGKTGQLQLGAGYSSVDKLVGFVSVTKRNFDPFDFWSFTGAGQEISFSAEYGGTKNSFSLSWTEPYWRNKPISIGFDAFNLYQEREGFDWRRSGGGIRLSHQRGEYGRLSYAYRAEQVEILNVTSYAPSDVQAEVGYPSRASYTRTTTSLTTGYTHDNRDDVNFPLSGHFFELQNQFASKILGGNVSFDRPSLTFSYFRQGLSKNHAIAGRIQYGTISNFFERNNPIPTAEKFYLGGANSVRGYRERSIQVYTQSGSLVGPGRTFMLGNLEYRIPFTDDKSFSMVFFYDVGDVYEGEWEFGLNDLKSAVGMGVRFNTPMGPIRLDYGYGLDFPNKNRGQFHFSIGQAF